jgi:hypothetical protein
MEWTPQRNAHAKAFRDPEGLRKLLARLQADGGLSWRTDPEASELMQYAAKRYAALAHRHGLDPWEAAAAAYDAMRAPSALRADDPWAIVTRAVQRTCIAEERAQGLLCSVHQARRRKFSSHHDAERFSDRERPLPDYHPAFRIDPADHHADASPPPEVELAVEDAIMLFTLLGWPSDRARGCVEYICARLADAHSRPSAFEVLRRDYSARALLDVSQRAWMSMLRSLLGTCDPLQAHTAASRGILLRLVVGEPLRALLRDDDLVDDIAINAPGVRA